MDDQVCPRCKTTKYRNPSLKLLVNICGHSLCDNCVELLFVKGSASCPECGVALRRSGFRVQLFEDPAVEKEVDIRRKILRDYCKQESDFATLREYNDYLEEVETIVFNLVNNIDVPDTQKRIEQYRRDNKEQISKSRSRVQRELIELEEILATEQARSEQRRLESLKIQHAERLKKVKSHEALIDDLMFSDTDAKSIVNSHKNAKNDISEELAVLEKKVAAAQASASAAFTSGIGFGSRGAAGFLPVPKSEELPTYEYEELVLDLGGLIPPTVEELKGSHNSYLAHIKGASGAELAGGFHSAVACRRALQDAFADITFRPKLLPRLQQLVVAEEFMELS